MKTMIMSSVLMLTALFVMAEWVSETEQDLMTQETVTNTYAVADAHEGALTEPVLCVRTLNDDSYELFIYWGGYSVDRDNRRMMVRFDDDKPESWSVSLSTTREAVFVSDVTSFLSEMRGHERVVAQISSATGRRMTALWLLEGFEE